jgi:hypothetical protein
MGGPVFKVVILVFSKVKIIVRNNKVFRRSVPFVFQPGRNGSFENSGDVTFFTKPYSSISKGFLLSLWTSGHER